MYCWVDSATICMPTVSCPQQPRSAPIDSCLWLLLWSQSISYLVFLFLLPSIFPTMIVFSKEPCLFMMCPKQDSFSVFTFISSDVSGLVCSRAHLFVFLVVQGRALLQDHFSNEFVFFPLSAFSSVHLLHLYIVIGTIRVWVILALVSKLRGSDCFWFYY